MDVFKEYGDKTAQGLNWIATNIREVIVAAYEKDVWTLLIWIELFLELAGFLSDDPETSEIESSIKEMIYYFVHDYDEIREMIDDSLNEAMAKHSLSVCLSDELSMEDMDAYRAYMRDPITESIFGI